MLRALVLSIFAFCLVACGAARKEPAHAKAPPSGQRAEAVFAGGCFWCMEADFDKLDGVLETISGYTGGTTDNPSYEDVVTETTGHYESVKVVYDPAKLNYATLLSYYWRHVDPTDGEGQFCDRGPSYRTAIFVANDEQKKTAEAQKKALDAGKTLPGPVATPVLPLGKFFAAEDYHQDFHDRNPLRYGFYRTGCGRDRRVKEVWSKTPALDVPSAKPALRPRSVSLESGRDFAATLESAKTAIAAQGFTLFTAIDHAAAAKKIGVDLPPETLLIFGNPLSGSPLMQAAPEAGLDLPLRVLVYEDAAGLVHVTRQNLVALFLDHSEDGPLSAALLRDEAGLIESIDAKLAAIADQAAGKTPVAASAKP